MKINKLYIRIGEIPPNEESGIYRGDRQVGKELGVSVYNGVFIGNKWCIVLPSPLREGGSSHLICFRVGFKSRR